MKAEILNQTIEEYQAPLELRRELGKVCLYAFVGPSGCGKDSVMQALESLMPARFKKIVSDASRRRRKCEVDGQTYNFRRKKDMISDLQNRKFVQVAPGSSGNFYGTRPRQFPTKQKAMMAVQAESMDTFKSLGFHELKWLHLVPYSHNAWQEWQASQNQSSEDQQHRHEEAINSYSLSLVNRDTYFVLNDSISDAAIRVIQIASGRRPVNETFAKQTALKNLNILKSLQ